MASTTEKREEWITVPRKGRRNPKTAISYSSHDNFSRPNPPSSSSLSASDIEKEHQRIAAQWEASSSCRQLQEIVASRASSRCSISNAICLGLGSFDPENDSWDSKRKSHVQLAAFLCMVEQLQRSSPHKIPCLFQEPVFNSSDKSFIQSLGHEVVESPEAFDRVTPSTLVFGVHLYKSIYVQAIAKHLPAVFVGTPLDVWEE